MNDMFDWIVSLVMMDVMRIIFNLIAATLFLGEKINVKFLMIINYLSLAVTSCNGQFIDLDHQHIYFTNVSKKIAWRGNYQNCNTFQLESIKITPFAHCTGVNSATIDIWPTNKTEYTISLEQLMSENNLLYFNISAYYNSSREICQTLSMIFQVDPEGKQRDA